MSGDEHEGDHASGNSSSTDAQLASPQRANFIGPLDILKQSIKQVPANKYAFGVVGIVAAVAVSTGLVRGSWQTALAGGTAMLIAMVLLRIFALGEADVISSAKASRSTQVLTWLSLLTFAVVVVLLLGKLYMILFPPTASQTTTASVKSWYPHPLPIVPKAIPPGRLLSVSPFRVKLDDCALAKCDVTLVLRRYDPHGRLRYEARERFANWGTGEFRTTHFDSTDKLYFQANETVTFKLYCKLGNGSMLVGDLDPDINVMNWTEYFEGGVGRGYAKWIFCGDDQFKASVGIGVSVAMERVNESAVKVDSGPPM
jgi:hypothetical protein